MARHDVIIVGAGHNGLVAAAYLARAGLDVLVCERATQVGGSLVNAEICPGFIGAGGAHDLALLAPRIISDLNLSAFGFELVSLPGRATLLQDGGYIGSSQNYHQSVMDIERYSPRDAARYRDYERDLSRQKNLFQPWLAAPFPDLALIGDDDHDHDDGHEFPKAATNILKMMSEEELQEALHFWFQSCKNLLDQYFETDALKAHIAAPSFIGAARGPFSPGTAYLLLHSRLGADVHGLQGMVRGGMQNLGNCLLQAVTAFGGEVVCSAEVSEVNIVKGSVVSVTLADGTVHEGKVIVSNLDLKRTFLTLFDWKALSDTVLAQVGHYRMQGSVAKMNIALDGLPEFHGLPDGSPLLGGKLHFSASLSEMERAYDCWKDGRVPDYPLLDVIIPSLSDPSLCPPGKHVLSINIQYIPNHLLVGHWDEVKKESLAARILTILAEHSPNVKDLMLGWTLDVPPDLEDKYALTGGDIHHGDMSLDQLLFNRPLPGYANNQTPFKNFYMCGASTHPGGGVMGMPGALAARSVLYDLEHGSL